MTAVEQDYDAGLFVPAYYGNRFSVATKNGQYERVTPARRIAGRDYPEQTYVSQMDLGFICNTLDEARAECDRRNR